MDEGNTKSALQVPLSPETQRRLTLGVAGAIAAVALVLALLIALRTPEYEAQARLTYRPADGQQLGSAALVVPFGSQTAPAGPAVAAASSALSDIQLARLIDQFDLYPQLRQKQSTAALTGLLREKLNMTEPESGLLQVTFHDADQATAQTVANGVASILADYQLVARVPAAAIRPASHARHATRTAKRNSARIVAPLPVSPPAILPSPVRTDGNPDTVYVAELTRQVYRVESALHDLQAARVELETEERQVATKIESAEGAERKAAAPHPGNHSEAARTERSVTEQDLAVEKAKLATLRERYTDAYPDVQATEDNIAKLQSALASTPASDRPASAIERPEAMEKLRQQKQRVERDLGQNKDAMEAEEQRKRSLLVQMQQITARRPFQPAPSNVPPPPLKTVVPAVTESDPSSVATMAVPVLPFRIVERAGSAALITTSKLTLGVWLGVSTVLLLALCFAPMVPAHYAAVVTTPEDLKKAMPEHVAYLGDVGRTEP